MIFKKPYAFLIKNFRLIHLLLTIIIGYLLFKTYNIYSFFSRYVENVYATIGDATPSNYITIFMFLTVIVTVVSSLSMFLLMKKKDKPKTLYVLISIYYTLLFISYVMYFVLFKSIESTSLSLRNAMIIRDLTFLFSLPQIAFLFASLIRSVGFDIKKFNFSKDLKELDLTDEDNEEFEFVFGVDSYKYFRKANRFIREFKYYILENKFMFTILMSLSLTIFVILTLLNFTVYNKTYNKNQRINANNLGITVNNAYLTNIDYKGQVIEDGKYFLVVNINFENNSGSSTVLELLNYVLVTKTGKIKPTLSRNNYFVDLGAGYSKEKIEPGTNPSYILVYELDKKQVTKKYKLNIIDSVEYKAGTMHAKIKKISIKPLVYNNVKKIGDYKLNENVTLFESILGDSSLFVSNYEFKNKFTYKYEACVRYSCMEVTDVVTADAAKDKTLMVLSGNLILDNSSAYAKNKINKLSFFDAFVQIKYDDKIAPVINVTPKSLQEQYIIEVNNDASKASKIDLIIIARDKEYVLNIK